MRSFLLLTSLCVVAGCGRAAAPRAAAVVAKPAAVAEEPPEALTQNLTRLRDDLMALGFAVEEDKAIVKPPAFCYRAERERCYVTFSGTESCVTSIRLNFGAKTEAEQLNAARAMTCISEVLRSDQHEAASLMNWFGLTLSQQMFEIQQCTEKHWDYFDYPIDHHYRAGFFGFIITMERESDSLGRVLMFIKPKPRDYRYGDL